MNSPFSEIKKWLDEEKNKGNIFPQGAVLSTISKDGIPRSRVVSTMLDDCNCPKFHTSPTTRKVDDINFNNKVSLTYSFQGTLRSIGIEGVLVPLADVELDEDWPKFDANFRRHYLIFGEYSGGKLDSITYLREKIDELPEGAENIRPSCFIGYKFLEIDRISFYSVIDGDFASSALYERKAEGSEWDKSIIVP